jgi:sugar/nucleoside kinase (ribokinase family)
VAPGAHLTAATPVVVIGDVMTDVLVRVRDPLALASDTPAEIRIDHGGSGANTAAWLASLGVPTTFVGAVGDDAFGREAARALTAAGVTARLTVIPEATTGICVVLVDAVGERTMLPDAGANAHLAAAHLPETEFAAGRHLHISGYSLINPGSRAAAREAIADAQSTGMTISVDAASAAPLRAVGRHVFLDATVEADTLLVTLDEAEVLCETRDADEAMRRLLVTYREVVLKLASEGAVWLSRIAPDAVRVPAVSPRGELIDSTGAGDAFAAGWLSQRRQGGAVGDSLKAACELAAQAVVSRGARPPSR